MISLIYIIAGGKEHEEIAFAALIDFLIQGTLLIGVY